ncbi:MAG TPA: hypothetical protein VGM81_25815 [Burkholderiaceae bacterium]|jgi:hypothetical protein
MYQLLMTGSMGWAASRGTLSRGRTFEHTDAALAERFKAGGLPGTLDVAKIRAVPAIFAGETDGTPTQAARLGTILNVTSVGSDYHIEYIFDPDVPPLTNTKLMALAAELGIDEWEFSRNHWAIKDVDLYKVLFRHDLSKAHEERKPTVFELAPLPLENDLVSVMMPFAANFSPVYEALSRAATGLNLRCQRADDIWDAHTVIQDVVSLISKAKYVICDLTGKNPNVFYEAGIAHAIGAEVILICQHSDDVPFDLRHLRYVTYLNNGEGLTRLATDVSRRLLTLVARG